MIMVKVVEKDLRKVEGEKRFDRLAEIAREVLGKDFSLSEERALGYIYCRMESTKESNFSINLGINEISVKDRKYMAHVVRLAQIYESIGEPEFTIKKDYVD